MHELRVVSIIFLTVVPTIFSVLVATTSAQDATVYVEPPSLVIPEVGQAFTMNISIGNVADLYGYDFMLWYDTTMIDCLDVEWPVGHLLTPSQNPSNIFQFDDIEDDSNATTGVVRVVTTLIGDEPSKSGAGTLVSLSFFSASTDGPSPMKLSWPGYVYPVKLSDRNGDPIPCTATDGAVTVVSELNILVTLVAMALTTVVILYHRKQRGRTSGDS